EEHLSGDEYLTRGAALEAIEVREALRVGLVGPIEPELLDLGFEASILDQRGRLDACADHIAGPALDRIRRVAVVAYQPSGPRRDVGPCSRDQGVEMCPRRLKPLQSTV